MSTDNEKPGFGYHLATWIIVGVAGYFFWYLPNEEKKAEIEAAVQTTTNAQQAPSQSAYSPSFSNCTDARAVVNRLLAPAYPTDSATRRW